MRYGSVCSGIEAASVAWHPLGWEACWLAEIEKFPSRVLAHHYPTVPNMHDMRQLPMMIANGLIEAPDVLVGGTPCQAFSVAGLRNSLEDDRGQLSITYIHIADAIDITRPGNECICVWENVPGILNTKDNAFGCFLAGLVGEEEPLQPPGGRWTDAGYVSGPTRSAAWRILDAQHFGLAQRRRRVFVVASARDGFDPAAVLFESEGVRRDTPPSRSTGQIAPTIPSRSSAGGGLGTDFDCDGGLIPSVCFQQNTRDEVRLIGGEGNLVGALQAEAGMKQQNYICMATGQAGADKQWPADLAATLNAHYGDKWGLEDQHALNGAALFVPAVSQYGPLAGSLTARHDSSPCADRGMNVVAFKIRGGCEGGGKGYLGSDNTAFTLSTGHDQDVLTPAMQVRRLTPTECERLQGFPDGYTNIPGAADGPRYKSLGNSMAVPVMAWIGRRVHEQ